MERLTARDEKGRLFVPNKDFRTDRKINGYDDGFMDLLNRLAKLEDKIENGTLVELPCKIGQLVYFIARCCDGCKYFNCNYIKAWCSLSANEITSECGNHLVIREKKFIFSMRDQIGKTIFLTRDEAEKRLEELRK